MMWFWMALIALLLIAFLVVKASARDRRGHRSGRWAFPAALLAPLAALILWPAQAAQAATPSNDNPAGAVVISSLPFATTLDTSEATFAADDPFSCGVATIWYSFTPQSSGDYAIRASSTDIHPVVAVRGRPFGDECYRTANANVSLTAGSTYLLMVGTDGFADPGQAGPGGTVQFSVDGPYPALAVTATVDRVTSGPVPGSLEVSGTASCNRTDADVSVSGSVSQIRGKHVNEAVFSSGVGCSTSPVRWTADAFSNQGAVSSGRASVTFSYFGCQLGTPVTCVGESTQAVVQVRTR